MSVFDPLIPAGQLYYCFEGRTVPYESLLLSHEQYPSRLSMFCHHHHQDSGTWGTKNQLRIQFSVPRLYGDSTQDELERFWYDHAQVMQLLSYGLKMGWKVLADESIDDEYDDILPHTCFPKEIQHNISAIRERIGLSVSELREMTKVDILRFACETYSSHGVSRNLDISATQNGHALRVQVSDDCLGGCIEDLVAEGWLERMHDRSVYRLVPAKSSSATSEIASRDKIVDQRLANFAEENGWVVASQRMTVLASKIPEEQPVGTRVFIVHGHDEAKRRELDGLLKDRFHLDPVIMKEKPGKSRTFIEKFEQEAGPCCAALAILTPDDVVEAEDKKFRQPRPNVLFELGWFAGRLGRDRVLLIVKEGTNTPTDLLGIEQIRFDQNISEKIPELEREIEAWAKNPHRSG